MKAYSFSQIGTRDNQEDALHVGHGIYLVCDGMGGHTKGEVASNFIIQQLLSLLVEPFTKQSIELAFNRIQDIFNENYGYAPETAGMGTTLCGVFVAQSSFYLAYAGDSRIYWAKPSSGKIWHTWDHSLVGELVRQGDITREQGRKHPLSNRISRAFIANGEGRTMMPDIFRADNVEEGDIFLLCTDGVIEAWDDASLVALLSDRSLSSEQKLSAIKGKCATISKDNNTAVLLEVEAPDAINDGYNEEIAWLTATDLQPATDVGAQQQFAEGEDEPVPPSSFWRIAGYILAFAVLTAAGLVLFNS